MTGYLKLPTDKPLQKNLKSTNQTRQTSQTRQLGVSCRKFASKRDSSASQEAWHKVWDMYPIRFVISLR